MARSEPDGEGCVPGSMRHLTFKSTCEESPQGFSFYRTDQVLLDGEPLGFISINIEISGSDVPVATIKMPVALELDTHAVEKESL